MRQRVRAKAGSRGAAHHWLAPLTLLICLLAYWPGLDGPLFFDDLPNLTENHFLDFDGRQLEDWRLAVFSNDAGVLHRPLAMLTFAANRVFAGELSPFQLKATNLGLHLLTGWLLYRLFLALLATPALRAMLPDAELRRFAALLGAAIWLLHPLHVSTVLYAIQRMAQLAGLFTVLGLLVFTRYRLRWAAEGAGAGELLGAGLWLALVTLAAVLCKENGALLPWLIVVVEVSLFRGLWAGRERADLRRLAWLLLILPLLALAAWFLFDPHWLDERYARREFTLSERLLTQARLLWLYAGWFALPDIGAMGFHHDDIAISTGLWSPPTTALSLFAWVMICGAALLLRRRQPLVVFTVLFYLVAHSLESSVWPLEMVFEHRNYLPSAALALLAGVTITVLGLRIDWWRSTAAGSVILLALALLLGLRTLAWGDEVQLAGRAVANHPQSSRAHFHYGHALYKALQAGWDDGFDENDRRVYTATAHAHFQRMHELAPREMAAPVMLYQLENSLFRDLPQPTDWLGVLATLAKDRPLQSSDRTALDALVTFAAGPGVGAEDRERVHAILDTLEKRYPGRPQLYEWRYRLRVAEGADRDALRALLLRGLAGRPDSHRLYPYLVKVEGAGDFGAAYEWMGQWLARDSLGRQAAHILGVLRP